ncbi:hypothetical protein [Evansella tamaricis]|uniref:Uncharacterized protein n=1 Tax=Evansella tamaricis TaxID=2069301 RepID=A0ABS6JGB9_9BACI|nr:hypothetical protein [Evansella tamaricis]MBU9711383.1 hypothetical protein [Evansella tamaricis]
MGSSGSYYRGSHHSIILINFVSILISTGAYLLNNTLLKETFDHNFFYGYFNDIFGGIMIVALANLFICVGKQNNYYLGNLKRILLFTFGVGLFWEYVTPVYNSSSVSDPWDIVAYMTGGGLYWLIDKFFNRKRIKR